MFTIGFIFVLPKIKAMAKIKVTAKKSAVNSVVRTKKATPPSTNRISVDVFSGVPIAPPSKGHVVASSVGRIIVPKNLEEKKVVINGVSQNIKDALIVTESQPAEHKKNKKSGTVRSTFLTGTFIELSPVYSTSEMAARTVQATK